MNKGICLINICIILRNTILSIINISVTLINSTALLWFVPGTKGRALMFYSGSNPNITSLKVSHTLKGTLCRCKISTSLKKG